MQLLFFFFFGRHLPVLEGDGGEGIADFDLERMNVIVSVNLSELIRRRASPAGGGKRTHALVRLYTVAYLGHFVSMGLLLSEECVWRVEERKKKRERDDGKQLGPTSSIMSVGTVTSANDKILR